MQYEAFRGSRSEPNARSLYNARYQPQNFDAHLPTTSAFDLYLYASRLASSLALVALSSSSLRASISFSKLFFSASASAVCFFNDEAASLAASNLARSSYIRI